MATEVWSDHKSKVTYNFEVCSKSFIVSVDEEFIKLSFTTSMDLILSITFWQFIGPLKLRFLNLK